MTAPGKSRQNPDIRAFILRTVPIHPAARREFGRRDAREGIFFTSRVFNRFSILSGNLGYTRTQGVEISLAPTAPGGRD